MILGYYIFIVYILVTVLTTMVILFLRDIHRTKKNRSHSLATLHQSVATITFLKNFLRTSMLLYILLALLLPISIAFDGFSYAFSAIAMIATAINIYLAGMLCLRCKRLYLR